MLLHTSGVGGWFVTVPTKLTLRTLLWTNLNVNTTVLYISASTCSKKTNFTTALNLFQQRFSIVKHNITAFSYFTGFRMKVEMWAFLNKWALFHTTLGDGRELESIYWSLWIQVNTEGEKKKRKPFLNETQTGCQAEMGGFRVSRLHKHWKMCFFCGNNCENKHGCSGALQSIPNTI